MFKNKIIKVGIYTCNLEKGIKLIDNLIGFDTKLKVIKTKDLYEVKCINSQYKIIKFNNTTRGFKFHRVYIDNELKNEIDFYEILYEEIHVSLLNIEELYYFD